MDALLAVRGCIAAALAGRRQPVDARLGGVILKSHQMDAVHRLRDALATCGGALLADAAGLGKTYVALALARDVGGAVVAAPAALRAQWRLAAECAGVAIDWCSLETLSRRPVPGSRALLIVDEAHHLRNPGTRRYRHTASLAVGRQVLLLTATPVHNRPADRDALLALFLGAGADAVENGLLARLIVRREADAALMPRRSAARWLAAPPALGISAALRALPPPLPASDGRLAAALVAMSLAHAWSSSIAALDAAVRRAIHRARALDDALSAGRWPTRSELRAWITTETSSQLAFAELVASPSREDPAVARAQLARHVTALDALRALTSRHVAADTVARAECLRKILRAHRGATILAFSRYAATVDALWRALRFEPGVAAITASGVRSAGGGLTRRDVLGALASNGAAHSVSPLRLVLSTDLLGEGLDLRAASVVVHLDQPWTPALLDQREGRAARLSSPHDAVAVYAMRPPRGAERLLALGDRHGAKRLAMARGTAAGRAREALLSLVTPWMSANPAPHKRAVVATARAATAGWVAAVRDAGGRPRVLVSAVGVDSAVEDDARLLELLGDIGGTARADPARMRIARSAVRRWLGANSSASLASARRGGGAARAAIARRLDEALLAVLLHQRSAMAARFDDVRARLTTLRGAGVERALAAAAQLATVDELVAAVERIEQHGVARESAPQRARLLALLLLTAGE